MFGCTTSPSALSIVQVPTEAVLPRATPTETLAPSITPTPTETLTPSSTWTPDVMATAVANGNATNAALQETLNAVWTAMAPTATPSQTYTPSATLLPSLTVTPTIAPSRTPTFTPTAQDMRPTVMYVRALVNLRTCASTDCDRVVQRNSGDAVMVTGRVQGQEVNRGNSLWYRIDNGGRQVYAYSTFLLTSPPTAVPPTALPFRWVTWTPDPLYSVPDYNPPNYSYDDDDDGGDYCVRYGAICWDGWISSATGRGACSSHGGVRDWLCR